MSQTIPLGELIAIKGGGTPSRADAAYWGGAIPWATVKDFKSTRLDGAMETITPEGVRNSATNLIPPGAVIVPTRMAVGKAAINTVELAINQDLKALLPSDRVDPRFLLHFMLSKGQFLESRAQGATVKGIKLDEIKRLDFPRIGVDEQRRIAAILDKADAIRRKREQALALADDLLRSAFLEMFGDPVTNSRALNMEKLSDLGRVYTGKTPPTKDPSNFGAGFPFVTPGDLGGRVFDASRNVSPQGARLSKIVSPGAALVCCIGATIGKIGIANTEVAFNQQINAVEWGDKIKPEYGYMALRFNSSRIAAKGASTTLPILAKSKFSLLEIPVPPLKLQEKFVKLYRRLTEYTDRSEASLNRANELFASLSQRAFRGEL